MPHHEIVLPENNEEDFLSMAERLGHKQVTFVYPLMHYTEKSKKAYPGKIAIQYGIIAKPDEVLKAKSMCRRVIVANSDHNRLVIEKLRPTLIYNLEISPKKDSMHQRNSGLNHILCAFASQHHVAIGFNYSLLQQKERRSVILGRMMQNMMLCRKYKLSVMFASFSADPWKMRAPTDVESLERIL